MTVHDDGFALVFNNKELIMNLNGNSVRTKND